MSNWHTCSSEVAEFVKKLMVETKRILGSHYVGFYLHGSLAIGGFNQNEAILTFWSLPKRELPLKRKNS